MERKKKSVPRTNLDEVLRGLDEVGRNDFFTPKEGKNVIRILPWKSVFYFKAVLHYGFQRISGDQKLGERAYPCLSMFNTDCPVCSFIEKIFTSGKEKLIPIAQRLKPVTKFYCNILDRDRMREGVKIYGFSSKMMRTIKGYLEDEDYGDITDPEEGRDLILIREGTGFTRTSYEIRVKPKPTPIDYENWEEELHELDKEVVQPVTKKFLEGKIEELKATIGKSTKPSKKFEDDELFEKEDEEEGELEDEDDE
ncbi:MAG: hypothetical protein K6T87_16090 [Roseiflexus sp.]|uniref:hypothetical protein n=1 Tax=Roseiflexus sp. TaxID=2562120 RepID=UPI0025ED895D|nr:hypothetical protein [Roseiflexus sp.]MCL6542077.1 hypothetical protein [Roseiflexus sp.]